MHLWSRYQCLLESEWHRFHARVCEDGSASENVVRDRGERRTYADDMRILA